MVFVMVKEHTNIPSVVIYVSGRRSHARSQSLTGSSRIHAPALALAPHQSIGGNCAPVVTRHPDNDTEEEEEEGR